MTQKIALLGLGTMGRGMAKNLLGAGYDLTVYNRTFSKAEALARDGAHAARTAAEATTDAALVISMLADDKASREAWLGADGALAAMPPGALAIECSTVSPDWVAELNMVCGAKGVRLLDAPVTGSRVQAAEGQLVFLTGGDAAAVAEATPVLRSMGKGVLHLGPVGSGAQLKLINNFLCGVQVASFAQALTWIERNGLDRAVALEFLNSAAPGSGITRGMSERMVGRTYDVNFVLHLMTKDLHYAQAAAQKFGVDLSTASAAEALFRDAEQQGHGERDMSAVVEVVRNAT